MCKITKQELLSQARSWIGAIEGTPAHRDIIDCYNAQFPLPRGYKMDYADKGWDVAFVSACFIRAGAQGMIACECDCQEMIDKNKTFWTEDEAYTPAPGDIIFYNWQDTKDEGANSGWSDHVGVVEAAEGKSLQIIEGSSSGSVCRVTRTISKQYLRGYLTPPYAPDDEIVYVISTDIAKTITTSLDYATTLAKEQKCNVYTTEGKLVYCYKELAKFYVPTTPLYMREGAGAAFKAVCLIPAGGKCKYLGEQGNWYNIEFEDKIGWANKNYLQESVYRE